MDSILSYEELDNLCENITRFFGVDEDDESTPIITLHEAHLGAVEFNENNEQKIYTFGPKMCLQIEEGDHVVLETKHGSTEYITNKDYTVQIDGKFYCKDYPILLWGARKRFKGLLVAVEISRLNGDEIKTITEIVDVSSRKIEMAEVFFKEKKLIVRKGSVPTIKHKDKLLVDTESNKEWYGILSWNGKTYQPSIRGYHSGERREAGPKGAIRVGVEIEKEKEGAREKISAEYLYDRFKWHAETDSSLQSDVGYELVSPIYALDKPAKMFEDLEALRYLIDTPDQTPSGRAGGHINVSTDIPEDELRKVDGYIGKAILKRIAGFVGLLYAMYPDRSDNNYSRASKLSEYIKNPGKRAFYPKRDRLEIRIFPEVQTVDDLKNRLLLVKYMITQATTRTDVVVARMFNPETNLHKLLNDMGYDVKELAQKVMEMNARFDKERFTASVHKKLGEYGVKVLTKVKRTKKEKDAIINSVTRSLADLVDDEASISEITNAISRRL